jgi:hypothetical protein
MIVKPAGSRMATVACEPVRFDRAAWMNGRDR